MIEAMADDSTRLRRRATFEEVPELYERARPEYPEALFDDLVELAELGPGDRIVEIGPGTGKATLPLARRGLEILGIELGARLAEVTRRKLAGFPGVQILNADFEAWSRTAGNSFAAVVAFASFHWIDPERRYEMAARVLRPRGTIAIVQSRHVLRENGDSFWHEIQEDYDALLPGEARRRPPHPNEVGDLAEEIEASGHFSDVTVRRHLWDLEYSADAFVALLDTHSDSRILEATTRQRLYQRIHHRVESRPVGRITATQLATLSVGRRL
ncbi:MAG: class I SAM-dependent methyltransferase [Gaiellaceae bacterium]